MRLRRPRARSSLRRYLATRPGANRRARDKTFGGRVSLTPGAISGSTPGMTDPLRWTQEVLKPAFERIGITGIAQQREFMANLFPNRNANRMFDMFLDPNSVSRIEKDRALYRQGLG